MQVNTSKENGVSCVIRGDSGPFPYRVNIGYIKIDTGQIKLQEVKAEYYRIQYSYNKHEM